MQARMLQSRLMSSPGKSALSRAADGWRARLPVCAGVSHPPLQVWAPNSRAASSLLPTQRADRCPLSVGGSPRDAAAVAGCSCDSASAGALLGAEQQPLTGARPSQKGRAPHAGAQISSNLKKPDAHAGATWNEPFLQFLNVLENRKSP